MPARPVEIRLMKMINRGQKGFTLVEIAIVLVIVGLLIGGMLKGREMLTNARLKRVERDHSGLVAAMQTYQDRYRVLPGDDAAAASRFPLYTDGVNDPAPADINGNSDGTVDGTWIANPNTETANFWKHLRAASLISGSGDDDSQPMNAYGGNIGIRYGSLSLSGHVIVYGSLHGPIARILEAKIDDGSPSTGQVQSDITAPLMDGAAASSAGTSYLDSTIYYLAIDI
jgi:prepilin-type N-terminal cleavage/methylation domain-containing protein